MLVYELDIRNLREFIHFFFRKKECPRCGRRVYRVDVMSEHSKTWERDGLKFTRAHKIKDALRYRCDPCHAYYSLQELAAAA